MLHATLVCITLQPQASGGIRFGANGHFYLCWSGRFRLMPFQVHPLPVPPDAGRQLRVVGMQWFFCHLRATWSSSNDGMIHGVNIAPTSCSMVIHRALSVLLSRPTDVQLMTLDLCHSASLCAVSSLLFA